jgi:hypothetical protein
MKHQFMEIIMHLCLIIQKDNSRNLIKKIKIRFQSILILSKKRNRHTTCKTALDKINFKKKIHYW